MGCNSSTRNTTALPISATERNIKVIEIKEKSTDVEEIIQTDMKNVSKVLLTCDNANELLHLSKNKNCMKDLAEPKPTKDLHNNTTELQNELDVKLSTMEEVVEKVVELYVSDKINEHSQEVDLIKDDNKKENKVKVTKDNDISTKTIIMNDKREIKDEKSDKLVTEPIETIILTNEAISPSQSESSRSTRWEALADIAAELPPSLAVDPITGQIYALSK